MTFDELAAKVLDLEKTVALLQQQVARKPDWSSPPGPSLTDKEREEMAAFSLYFRTTGDCPPKGWKPGDPIPELGEC